MSDNPLLNHFRRVEVYIPLPSKGKYYPATVKDLNIDNEIGIYPMTMKDELAIKNADSLYNGEALFKLIESCAPSIDDAKNMPICDVDPILLGIKYASIGKEMDVSVKCPSCQTESEMVINIQNVLGRIKPLTKTDVVDIDGMGKIHIKPYSLNHRVRSSIQQSKNYQLINVISTDDITDEDRQKYYNEIVAEQSLLLTDLLTDCIVKVVISEDVTVTDKNQIREWVENIDKKTYELINEAIADLSNHVLDNTLDVECPECSHKFITSMEINPFTFFT